MPVRNISVTDAEQKQILAGTLPSSIVKKVQNAGKKRNSRYSKGKGAFFQKEVADFLAGILGVHWDNTDDNSPINTRTMGSSGVDIIFHEPLYSQFPYDIECKNAESLSVPATIEQVKANQKEGRDWLIFWKRKSFDSFIAIMDKNTLAKLLKK